VVVEGAPSPNRPTTSPILFRRFLKTQHNRGSQVNAVADPEAVVGFGTTSHRTSRQLYKTAVDKIYIYIYIYIFIFFFLYLMVNKS